MLPGPLSSVVVVCRQFHRQIRHPQLFVHRDLRPHTRVPGVHPRISLPRVVAEFAEPWDRPENPETLPRPHVVATDGAFHILTALGVRSGFERGADNDHVLGDDGCRMKTNRSSDEIEVLIELELQIHEAVLTEPETGMPVFASRATNR